MYFLINKSKKTIHTVIDNPLETPQGDLIGNNFRIT